MKKLVIENLDEAVNKALEFISKSKLPKLDISFTRPLVVGSGNAAATGRILFQDRDAVFADESTYETKLAAAKGIDGAVLISASGGKHAPIIAQKLKERGIKTILLTSNPKAQASSLVDRTYVFPKIAEPYTYNTVTYLAMILAKTGEKPQDILKLVNTIKKLPNFKKYDAFFLIVPEKFDNIREMLYTKFDELFGPMINKRICTPEQVKHAKTVIPYGKEFFISFGYKNELFGKKSSRWNIPLPDNSDYGSIMALSYYIVGKIQGQQRPYFKENIERYCKETSKMFSQDIKPIIE
jgi:hypothetical protein